MIPDSSFLPAREAVFTAIDFETTGSVPGWPNEPWQIGMCEVSPSGGGRRLSAWLHVSRERPFNRYAPGRHAQLRDELDAAPPLPAIWDAVSPWLRGRPLVAHNIGTERSILRAAAPLERLGPWVDTLRLARRQLPTLPSYALEDVIAALGLSKTVRAMCPGLAPHDALFDAVACGVLLRHFLDQPGWERVTVADIAVS